MMATKKTMRFKEADQIIDQNVPTEQPVPATDQDVAQAVDTTTDVPVDTTAEDEIVEPATTEGEAPAEGEDVQVNPETVSVSVQIPTEQLAAAVAQVTGDMEVANTAPDAVEAQDDELVQQNNEEDVPVEGAVDDGSAEMQEAPSAPVMESKKSNGEKIKESEKEDCVKGSEIATGHDESRLEDIISDYVPSAKQDKQDLIDNGVDTMGKDLKEAVEDEEIIDGGEADVDSLPAGFEGEEAQAPELEDGELPEGFSTDDIDEGAVDDFLAKIDAYLADDDSKPAQVADALRASADFFDAIDPENEGEDVEDEEIEDGMTSPDDIKDYEGDIPLDFNAINDYDIEDIEPEIEDDEIEESLVRVPCKFPKRVSERRNRESSRNYRMEESKKSNRLNEAVGDGIVYPAGSSTYNDDMVEAHEKVIESRRKAIRNFRETVQSNEGRRNSRFNEALRSSVRMRERTNDNPKSWRNNQTLDKYEESTKLNFKEMIENGWWG